MRLPGSGDRTAPGEGLSEAGRARARLLVLPRLGNEPARLAIARRVAVDHIRVLVRQPRTTAIDDWESAAELLTQAETTRFDETVVLTQLLSGLTPDRREAFVATQILGLSYAEAADVCDCPVGTIRSRVARARDDLVAATQTESPAQQHLRAIS